MTTRRSTKMQTNLLTDAAFHATFSDMLDVTDSAEPALDIWPYVESVSAMDLDGTSIVGSDVETVYRTGDGRFDHVLIPTNYRNIYLVLVVDRLAPVVFGHHLLNLNDKYGLPDPRP